MEFKKGDKVRLKNGKCTRCTKEGLSKCGYDYNEITLVVNGGSFYKGEVEVIPCTHDRDFNFPNGDCEYLVDELELLHKQGCVSNGVLYL